VVDVLREILAQCIAKRSLGEPQPSVGDFFDLQSVRSACIKCAQDPNSSPAIALQFVEDHFVALREQCIQRCRRLLVEILDQAETARKKQEEEKRAKETTKAVDRDEKDDGDKPSKRLTTAKSKTEPAPQVDRLKLATSYFYCKLCETSSLRFPDVLAHKCARHFSVGAPQRGQAGLEWVAEALSTGSSYARESEGRWNYLDYVRGLPADAMSSMLAVLDLRKLDPEVTTFDEVEGSIVECLLCNSFAKGRCLMDWTGIVSCLSF